MNALFSTIQNRILHTYELLYNYFVDYLALSDRNTFTVRFYRESYQGFDGRSNIGSERHGGLGSRYLSHPQTQAELCGTSQTFTIRKNGIIDKIELNRMIANIIYYTNHYEGIAEIMEGTGVTRCSRSALVLDPYRFLDSSYFYSSYKSSKAVLPLSSAAKELYGRFYNSLLSYSVFYNALSDSGMLSGYLLQEGNNLKMRELFNNYFLRIAELDQVEQVHEFIANLGYTSYL